MSITILVASSDEAFRESVKENLASLTGARVVAEYTEVTANLYIRVLQDAERHSDAALVMDLSGDPEAALKSLEKIKQAIPDPRVVLLQIDEQVSDGGAGSVHLLEVLGVAAQRGRDADLRHGALSFVTAAGRREVLRCCLS